MFGKVKKAKDVIKESWGIARGELLKKEFEDTFLKLNKADLRLMMAIISHSMDIYIPIANNLWNMTNEGKIKTGKKLQDDARKILDLDVSKGYALWIIGAWMESEYCPGDAAKYVHTQLNDLLINTAIEFGEYDLINILDKGSNYSDKTKALDKYYSIVAEELASDEIHRGLWLKAYTLANGDDKVQKVLYTRFRTKELEEQDKSITAKETAERDARIAKEKSERKIREREDKIKFKSEKEHIKDISKKGLIVVEITDQKIAAKIDIKVGDIIISYDVKDVRGKKALLIELQNEAINSKKDSAITFVSGNDVLEAIAPMGILGVIVAQLA